MDRRKHSWQAIFTNNLCLVSVVDCKL